MRLVHFADTHLGFSEGSKIDPATGINAREQDVYSAFNAVVDEAVRLRPDFVVHAGDLFHSPRPSNRAIVTALVGAQRLSEAGIPFVLIAGNHSVPRIATTGSIFEALRVLPGVHFAHLPRYEVFRIGDTAVHCLPHMATDDQLRKALATVRVDPKKRFNILVMHGAIDGTGEAYSLQEFNEVRVSKAVLARLSAFDYIALGHFHRHMPVGTNAWYSGSPERFHRNEASYDKGFVEFDLASRRLTFHRTKPREMRNLPPIPCKSKTLGEIIGSITTALRKTIPADGEILFLRLEEIDSTTWLELQRERKSIERESAPGVFEVRWDRTLSSKETRSTRGASIGTLAAEFSLFMKTAKVEGLRRSSLAKLGGRLLADASEEALEE